MSSTEQALCLEFKQALGSLQHLDLREMDALSAHRKLGQQARAQIWRILKRRLDELGDAPQVAEQIQQAQRARKALLARLERRGLNETMREALEQYMACLASWADGAGLAEFRHIQLPRTVDAVDLATFLQEDEVGCQTGVYRERDGTVILWHTEEDMEREPGERFDKLRLFSFRAFNGRSASGFIYPDLLPGPSFAWQANGFAQAIDTLHVKSVDFEDAILPNTLAWLSLYLGAQVPRAELARQLGPFRGGYSLTAVYKKDGRVDVEKVEYANDALHVSQLEHTAGSHLFQTNVIRDLRLPIGAQEQTSPASRAWNEKRMARTGRFLQVIQNAPNALALIFRMLRSRLGDDSAYANHDVKAYLVCRMAAQEMRLWVGNGAPMAQDELFSPSNL